jgi:hypothetical protein
MSASAESISIQARRCDYATKQLPVRDGNPLRAISHFCSIEDLTGIKSSPSVELRLRHSRN